MKNPFSKKNIRMMRIHMVGIKGVGMTALTEILNSYGAKITGSDTTEIFYTDEILKKMGINFFEDFLPEHITEDIDLVIHSMAYSKEQNKELKKANIFKIPILTYPQALGFLSQLADSSGISGVHGKTTTTAMAGTILRELKLPVTVLAGSEVPTFNYHSTYLGGDDYFVAETCEYQRNFLNFKPARIVITSIEEDHLDYFKDFKDIVSAFVSYANLLPRGGEVIYNYDDPGAREAVNQIVALRSDIQCIPYGRGADGAYQITGIEFQKEQTRFSLQGFKDSFIIKIPGTHSVFNATAALALCIQILKKGKAKISESDIRNIHKGLFDFKGSKRRSEIIGETHGILFMDDYAHHPTAILATLSGIKEYYPQRRIIVDFMSHTYSRTKALLTEFGKCFGPADEVVLHKIYASARERDTGEISGRNLFMEVKKNHNMVLYFEEIMDALPYLKKNLKAGDLFITMGAGNNWQITQRLYDFFASLKTQ
jgi:UDP-N-acetylmuramate--alanine ligase